MTDSNILLSTQGQLSDYKITKTLGLVRGNTVRSRNVGRNFLANLKTVLGGEVREWTKAVEESRDQAIERLIEHAQEMGADAVVGLRFITTEVGANGSASEILAYGTAVKTAKP